MATTPATRAPAKTGRGLSGKWHGIPVWLLAGGGGVVVFLGYRWWKGRSASTTTTPTTTAATDTGTGLQNQDYGGYGSGGGGTGGGVGAGADVPPPVDNTPPPGDNTPPPVVPVPVTPPGPTSSVPGTGGPPITQERTAVSTAAAKYYSHPTPANKRALDKAAKAPGLKKGEVVKLETGAKEKVVHEPPPPPAPKSRPKALPPAPGRRGFGL